LYLRKNLFGTTNTGNRIFREKFGMGSHHRPSKLQHPSCHGALLCCLTLVAADLREAVLQVNLEQFHMPSTWTVAFIF